jgi:GNAT superfamily N-acetyltransferase
MASFWNERLASRNIQERFEKGASLWLVECEGQLAGYSWTIRGRAIAAYYFPIAQDDVQLFDFYVFPKFRGRAILWFLVADILQTMRAEGAVRVFGDVAEWNQPSLSFYKMTPFRLLGLVRTYKIFGQVFTCWAASEPADRKQKGTARSDRAMKVLRPNG